MAKLIDPCWSLSSAGHIGLKVSLPSNMIIFFRDCFLGTKEGIYDLRVRTCVEASTEFQPSSYPPVVTAYKCLLHLEATYDFDHLDQNNMLIYNGYIVVRDFFSATMEICFLGIVLKIVSIFFVVIVLQGVPK